MKPSQNQDLRTGSSGSAEQTLRVIANLPAPDGLVDRVQTRLRTAPHAARTLNWSLAFAVGGWGYGPAVRGAAAAAIVCVVAGGGWRIYSHVQPAPSTQVIMMPGPTVPARGFSTAGSVYTPDPRPVLTHAVEPLPPEKSGVNEEKKSSQGADAGLVRAKRPGSGQGNTKGKGQAPSAPSAGSQK